MPPPDPDPIPEPVPFPIPVPLPRPHRVPKQWRVRIAEVQACCRPPSSGPSELLTVGSGMVSFGFCRSAIFGILPLVTAVRPFCPPPPALPKSRGRRQYDLHLLRLRHRYLLELHVYQPPGDQEQKHIEGNRGARRPRILLGRHPVDHRNRFRFQHQRRQLHREKCVPQILPQGGEYAFLLQHHVAFG